MVHSALNIHLLKSVSFTRQPQLLLFGEIVLEFSCRDTIGVGAGLGTLVAALTYTRFGPRWFYAMCAGISLVALCVYVLIQFVLLERCEPHEALATSAADTAEQSAADDREPHAGHRRAENGDRHVLYNSARAHDLSDDRANHKRSDGAPYEAGVGGGSAASPSSAASRKRAAAEPANHQGETGFSSQEHRVDVDERLHILHNDLDDSEPEVEIRRSFPNTTEGPSPTAPLLHSIPGQISQIHDSSHLILS